MAGPTGVSQADGSLDWAGGVDSVRVPTIQSQANPNGLARNQLAWLDNATVRDSGISPRGGYTLLGNIHTPVGLWQGGFLYDPLTEFPYLICAISGHIFKVVPGTPPIVTDLSVIFGQFMPSTLTELFYFCQGEKYLVIQAGDFTTLPLFWDNVTLRRSIGITNTAVAPGTPGVNEIPSAGAMDYFMGRLWYAKGRSINAGDIVKGPSGTLANQFDDAILNVTENPLVVGGDGFTLPTQAGSIRAVFHNANINATLGQGNLLIGTRRAVYQLNVPVTRTDWIGATNTNQPQLVVVQLVNGPVNDKSVVQVNGDVYYQSLEPSIRSLLASLRYWNQPGNIEISNQEQRVLQFNDRSLMRFGSGIEFANRLLESALPRQTPQGVVHDAVVPLDFVPMSTFGGSQQPIWEGMYEPPPFFQMWTGDYGGLQRAFQVSQSNVDGSFELWELSDLERFDKNRFDDSARIQWYAEFPALTWGDEFQLKQLTCGELWVDRVFGTVVFNVEYRPDGETCWLPWHIWQICSAKNSCEDVHNPICYPIVPFGEGYRATMTLPKPPTKCEVANRRPSDWGYQFQTRLRVRGYARIRGLVLYCDIKDRQLYAANVCGDLFKCPPGEEPDFPSVAIAPVLPDIPSVICFLDEDPPGYSATITATGGPAPFVYTPTGVPDGMTFTQINSLSAVLAGQPNVSGVVYTMSVKVVNAAGLSTTRIYTLYFPDVNNPLSTHGHVGVAYSFQLVTVGGPGQPLFTLTSGTFPPGLTLGLDGLISGTPTLAGTYDFFIGMQWPDGTVCHNELVIIVNP